MDILIDIIKGSYLVTCEEFFEEAQNINISGSKVTLDSLRYLEKNNCNELKFVLDQIDSLLPDGNISTNGMIKE